MPSSPPHLSFLTPWMFKSGFLEKRTNPGHLLSFISLFQAVVEYVKRDPDKEHSGCVCVCIIKGVWGKESVQRTYRSSLLCDLSVHLLFALYPQRAFSEQCLGSSQVSFLSGVEHSHYYWAKPIGWMGWEARPARTELGPGAGLPPLLLLRWASLRPSGLLLGGLFIMSESFNHLGRVCVPCLSSLFWFLHWNLALASANVLKNLFIVVHCNWETDLVS